MSNRFTERAQRVILIAQEEAKRLNHDYVGTEHLLLGLIALGEGVAAQVLANLGVDLRRVRGEIEKIVGTGDNVMLLGRSEEHTSELQSRFDLVCRLLLEKKNKT